MTLEETHNNIQNLDSLEESLKAELVELKRREELLFESHRGETIPTPELKNIFDEYNRIKGQLEEIIKIKKEHETVSRLESVVTDITEEADTIFKMIEQNKE